MAFFTLTYDSPILIMRFRFARQSNVKYAAVALPYPLRPPGTRTSPSHIPLAEYGRLNSATK